jgi:hypothetical protein
MAVRAKARMLEAYKVIINGINPGDRDQESRIGVRSALTYAQVEWPDDISDVRVVPRRIPAFHVDRIVLGSASLIAFRPETERPRLSEDSAAAALAYNADVIVTPFTNESDPEDEDSLQIEITRRDETGNPMYQEVALYESGSDAEYKVWRKGLESGGHDTEPKADPEEYAKIAHEATDVIIEAAEERAREAGVRTKAEAVIEALDALPIIRYVI